MNIKKAINNTKTRVQETLKTNSEILKCDFQYSPRTYSILYTGLMVIGFTTGLLLGNLLTANKETK